MREPPRGRPRDAARDAAILDATVRGLTELGYDNLSVEGVATQAGVAKTTIYRRYPNKAALVVAAVESRAASTPPAVVADDLRGALLEVVRWLAEEVAQQEIGLLGAIFAGLRSDPELAAEMRRIRRRDENLMVKAALAGSDQLAPQAAELFAEIAPALVVHRVVIGQTCDGAFVEHVVDDILLPLLHRPNEAQS